ncbi:MAG: energy transducer TonB [Chthoniobacterales bacterium]|nr:energy transducer TonB [Chthoniobacterales bacterium]
MGNISFQRGAMAVLGLGLLVTACGKKAEPLAPSASTPTPSSSFSPANELGSPAPIIADKATPAVVTQNDSSITHFLHFPEDAAAAKRNSVVQFYCDISEQGTVEATYALVGSDEAFKSAVQSALDWGRFTPATVDGKAVPVYLAGTVIFGHENGSPIIAVSLATHDRERVGRLANYIQPQLLGGLRQEVAKIIRLIPHKSPVAGIAQATVEVDAKGALTKVTTVGESPKGSGLGELLKAALNGAQCTHAYQDGKATDGAVDVVADFSKL